MLVNEITVHEAAANPATLRAVLVSLTGGAVVLVPSLVLLFVMFQRSYPSDDRQDDVTPRSPVPSAIQL